MDKKDARSWTSVAQEEIRRRAVQAVRDGMTQLEAARIFGITRQTVGVWVKKSRHRSLDVLAAKRKGRPFGKRLPTRQMDWIARAIANKPPDQLRLPFYLWTREAVGQLIERKYGVRVSVWTVGRYLRTWGFTPQKPIRRAFEADPEAVRRWLEVEYPAIKALALREKAEIYWGDEMGLRSDHVTGTSWGLRGRTLVIPGTGQRFSCGMISAITNRGRLYFMVLRQRLKAELFIDFVRRLERQVPRRIFLIVDRLPAHRSATVKTWLKKKERRVRLFYLPGYRPGLNPDEYLNQDVKSNAVGRRRPANELEMRKDVSGYLKSRQRLPRIVRNYFKHESVRYAA
ncbi:MAG: IS630 family transposase [Candidatus Aminicenantales bacterium]